MGGSSPPFLYDPPSKYTFDGPTDRGFNPRAVTQASWSPRQPAPKINGPLVTFNRHPDTYTKFPYGNVNTNPMSPKTKNRVKYGRYIQLFLRVCTLVGALGALFCVICIKGTSGSVAWIIRVAPAVAIVHTVYAVYHLCRAPTGRTPASSASYMLFASTVDAGLIPFYTFTAFVAHGQYADDYYHWDTLFESPGATYQVAYATFLVSAVNGALHVASLILSIYLAIIFRQISKLPPDMNPLEDNLTSRSHKRNKSELTEKHLSQSTLDLDTNHISAVEDPLIGPPRSIPFMHTRGNSSSSVLGQSSPGKPNEKRASGTSGHLQRPSRSDLPSQQMRLYEQSNKSSTSLARSVARKTRDCPSRPTSAVIHDAPVLEPSTAAPIEVRNWSPSSSLLKDNWFTYPSPSSSPVNDPNDENNARREPSSVYSRTSTPASSAYSGFKDWVTSPQKSDHEDSKALVENALGEYTSLSNHEFYGNDDGAYDQPQVNIYNDAEQDLGERKLSISTFSDDDAGSRVNPLGMNPPTPQPPQNEPMKAEDGLRRIALTDIPNPSVYNTDLMPPIESPESQGRFYGDLENRTGLSTSRKVSGADQTPRSKSKKGVGSKRLSRRKSGRGAAYESLKADDNDSDGPDELTLNKRGSKDNETDRNGRVVSNSGVDIGAGFQPGSGSPSSYGNYIAGLGVGRRRDVSGKIAEEGRGGTGFSDVEKTPEKPTTGRTGGIRAAGWARFAGM